MLVDLGIGMHMNSGALILHGIIKDYVAVLMVQYKWVFKTFSGHFHEAYCLFRVYLACNVLEVVIQNYLAGEGLGKENMIVGFLQGKLWRLEF